MKTQKTTTGIFLIIAWSIILLTIPSGNVGSQHHSGGVSDNRLHIEPLIRPADFNFRKEGELPPLPTVRLNVKGSDALINDITIGRGGGGFQENTALGYLTLYFNTEGSVSKSYEGKYNTAVGAGALHKNELGSFNTSVGALALYSNVGGYNNTALGYATLYGNTSGACNTALGFEALRTNSSGGFNTAVGVHALVWNNGSGNTAVGFNAMEANTTGSSNTAVGYRTLELNIVGENNTAVGYKAGKQSESDVSVTEGTFVGADAYPISNDLFNVTGIGYGARPTQSNQVWLGNEEVTWIGGWNDYYAISDGKYKSKIEDKVKGLNFILKLRPVTYQLDVQKYRAEKENMHLEHGRDSEMAESLETNQNNRDDQAPLIYSGFIAQEVEIAANESGYEFSGVRAPINDHDLYSLSYGKFVVPIVKAIQEQQAQIELLQPATVETMQQELEALREEQIALLADNQRMQKQLSDILSVMDALGDAIVQCCNMEASNADHPDWHDGKPRLEQNAPNPFNEHTLIRYYLPPDTQQASIVVTDFNGVQRKVIDLSRGGGAGQTIIHGGTLTPGTYIYTLRVNGQQTDSKLMVLL